ncbi:MAG: PqqD family protein [Deltaproteobacteria bacterium]|nr:PqqD family protein [Deltaproteobacteria bacterium]
MKKQLTSITVSDTGFVFDPSTGQTFLLNKTGLSLVKMLQAGTSLKDTPAFLEKEYDVEEKDAKEDIREFVSLMRKMGFKVENT